MADIAIKEPKEVIEADKVGRPCLYSTHVEPRLEEVREWVKEGYTDYSIAEQLGINRYTLQKYKENYVELIDAYTRAIHERNCLVMNKMYSKACGEKVSLNKQKLTKDGDVVDIIEEQYIPPDVNAADLYLRNHMDNYKSAKSDLSSGNITINNFNSEEWQVRRKEILSEIQKAEAIEVNMD